jgi:ribonuclease D
VPTDPIVATLHKGDVSRDFVAAIRRARLVAIDTETTGLDWRTCEIATCQLFVPGYGAALVQLNGHVPRRIASVIRDAKTCKVFHHAMFDLRFMRCHWGVLPTNIACTKIASKLLDPRQKNTHTLKSLLNRHLGIRIAKRERLSNWLSDSLSPQQVKYATHDVVYLVALLNQLVKRLQEEGLTDLAGECFAHIPTRVELDTRGYSDIYSY